MGDFGVCGIAGDKFYGGADRFCERDVVDHGVGYGGERFFEEGVGEELRRLDTPESFALEGFCDEVMLVCFLNGVDNGGGEGGGIVATCEKAVGCLGCDVGTGSVVDKDALAVDERGKAIG